MGHESVTLEYRIFLENRFKDNGFVRFTAKWIKKDENGEIIELNPQEIPMIDDNMIKQRIQIDISEKLRNKFDEIWS
jgi:hypothetical protein